MKTTALIYVRQSRTEKDKLNDSLSLAVQEEKCRSLPAVAECDEVIVYRDANKSGQKARATFEALTGRIREGNVSVVAYYDQSRAFRNTRLFLEFTALMSEPDYRDIPVVPVHGEFKRTPIGRFNATILAATHQMEAEMIGQKIGDAYRSLNAQGVPTGAAAYGYRYVGQTRTSGALQPDPERAPVVRRIFEMYANGTKPREIAQTLYQEGIPANSRRGPAPENWKADTVTAMLSNITYIGKTYSVSRRDKTGDIIPASWPATIEDGLFQRVKDRLTRLTPLKSQYKRASRPDGKPARKQNPKTMHPFVFRGLLWCHECQRRFVSQRQSDGVRYFCGSRETTQPCEHAKHSIREGQFLPWVDDLMTGLEKGQLERLVQAEYGSRLRKPLIAKETAAGAIENIDGQIKRLDTRFGMGTVTEAEFKAELADLRRRRAVYQAQLGQQPNPKELEGLAQRWRAGDERERHELLSTLFEKLHVHHGRIFGCTPRADRVNRVHLLLGTALDYVDGPGAANINVERRGRDLNSRWASDP